MTLVREARAVLLSFGATFSLSCFTPDAPSTNEASETSDTTSAGTSFETWSTATSDHDATVGISHEDGGLKNDGPDDGEISPGDDLESGAEVGHDPPYESSVLEALDDHYLLPLGEHLTVTPSNGLLANDRSSTEQALFASVASSATTRGGMVVLSANGSFIYIPPTAFWGTDEFSYAVSDEDGNSAPGKVTISIRPRIIDLLSIPQEGRGYHLADDADLPSAGSIVASAGDINGDGISDVVVGSYSSDWNGTSSGRAYVVFGTEETPSSSLALESILDGERGFAVDGEPYENLGVTLSPAGDIDADGFDDVLIGSPRYDLGTNSDAGRCYVIFGSHEIPTTPIKYDTISDDAQRGFVLEGTGKNDKLCTSARSAGDFNGDGLTDVAISASERAIIDESEEGVLGAGEAYLLFGSVSRPQPYSRASRFIANGHGMLFSPGESGGTFTGRTLDGIGDFNGDGLDDLLIDAILSTESSGTVLTRAYLVFGTRATESEVVLSNVMAGNAGIAWSGPDGATSALPSVAGIGDFNGDGLADFVVGDSRGSVDFSESAGYASVVFGQTDPTLLGSLVDTCEENCGFIVKGIERNRYVGRFTAGIGDFNGDGLDDFVTTETISGSTHIYLIFGTRKDLPRIMTGEDILDSGYGIGIEVGGDGLALWSVSGAGDVNGDGLADIVIGTNRGAHVLFGATFTDRAIRRGERMTGTDADETFIGTAANDVISPKGESDVVYAGRGDDEIILEQSSFSRIDGGAGVDLVRIKGEGILLDLTQISANAFRSIEIIDITGSGTNHIRLDTRSLTNLSGNMLSIRGNDDDEVDLDLRQAGFSAKTLDSTHALYTNGALSIQVAVRMKIRAEL